MTMNVSLTPELEKFVASKVKSGLYTSASEVIRESLRLLRREDELAELQLSELRKEIRNSITQLDEGKGIKIEKVHQLLKSRRSNK